MATTTNVWNVQHYIKLSLIIEQILAFALSIKLVIEVKNMSPNFKRIS